MGAAALADVERLSAVQQTPSRPVNHLTRRAKAEAESYVDMLAEVADFDPKVAAAEKALAEEAAAKKAAEKGNKLCDAALEGDLNTAETLLNRGAQPISRDSMTRHHSSRLL